MTSVALSAQDPPRAVLVGVDLGRHAAFDPTLDELSLLAESAGDKPVARLTARRQAPDPALFVGLGKADEIKALVEEHQAHCVIFDQALGPSQQRNLERHLGVEVLDRTMLILEIFAERARSHEGKLQVELARLQYLSTRLVRRWTHLERQRGGVGHRGGPGETQIELDRRMITTRIKSVKERLSRVKRQRATQRRSRERRGTFQVSLVGYTNAGKSTLFNTLVKADTYAADQLFATLDTTTRRLYLEDIRTSVSVSDTVGFIRDLPHALVEAFQATLQEAADADLLLHVVDAARPAWQEQLHEVERVLHEIGASDVPQILLFNKLDLIAAEQRPRVLVDRFEIEPGRSAPRLFASARHGEGLAALREAIASAVRESTNGQDRPDLNPDSAVPSDPGFEHGPAGSLPDEAGAAEPPSTHSVHPR